MVRAPLGRLLGAVLRDLGTVLGGFSGEPWDVLEGAVGRVCAGLGAMLWGSLAFFKAFWENLGGVLGRNNITDRKTLFFDWKVNDVRGSGGVSSMLKPLKNRFGALWRRSRALLGGFWVALGCSWAAFGQLLGGSLAAFGRL